MFGFIASFFSLLSHLPARLEGDLYNWAFSYRVGTEPVYLQGVEYRALSALVEDAVNVAFETHAASIPWLTYRRDFPAFYGSFLTSDFGWGCTLRSAQMMAASALMWNEIGPDEFRSSLEYRDRMHAVSLLFVDSAAAPLSIHRMIEEIRVNDQSYYPGQWVGPDRASTTISRLLESKNLMGVVVAQDRVLARSEALHSLAKHDRMLLIASTMVADPNNWSYFDLSMKTAFLNIFRLPQLNGIVGGELLSQSYFFVGASNDFLFYLDPHTVQPALQEDEAQLPRPQPKILCMRWNRLSSSMSLSFVIESMDEFEAVASALEKIGFAITDSRPSFDSVAEEIITEDDLPVEEEFEILNI